LDERVDGGSLWLDWSSSQWPGRREKVDMVRGFNCLGSCGGSYLNHRRPGRTTLDTGNGTIGARWRSFLEGARELGRVDSRVNGVPQFMCEQAEARAIGVVSW
jgi:hypothetical protein